MDLCKALTSIVTVYIALGYIAQIECEVSQEDMYEVLKEKMNFTIAELECQKRGFDGLAIFSSPEEFNYALHLTEIARKRLGLWVALVYDVDLNKLLWLDGADVAPDMPWVPSQRNGSAESACGRIHIDGWVGMIRCRSLRYAVCGYYTRRFLEATGSTHASTLPASITSSIGNVKVRSYLHCITLCSRLHLCRAAWFGKQSSTCTLLGPGGFKGLSNRQDSQTFIRTEYKSP